jgi:hypothetical protein
LNLPPPPFFILPSPIPGTVPIDLIFPFTYMCTQYLHHIHLPPFPHFFHTPTGTNLPSFQGKTFSALLFSDFVKEKK